MKGIKKRVGEDQEKSCWKSPAERVPAIFQGHSRIRKVCIGFSDERGGEGDEDRKSEGKSARGVKIGPGQSNE